MILLLSISESLCAYYLLERKNYAKSFFYEWKKTHNKAELLEKFNKDRDSEGNEINEKIRRQEINKNIP